MGTGAIIGLLLIAGGTILFLDNLGIFPFPAVDLFWPVIFLIWGGFGLSRRRSAAGIVWSVTAIVAGLLLALGAFHILRVSLDTLWPLLLIATGIIMLIYRFRWIRFADRIRMQLGSQSNTRVGGNNLEEFAVFSSVKRKIESQSFEGGEISSLFGGVEIDLRRAGISSPDRQALIRANAAFGGIEIRVPQSWRVLLQGSAIFGAYEDKTIPPRPEPGVEIPTLIIRGGTAFGAVVVKN
jgi:predicted membrane protein